MDELEQQLGAILKDPETLQQLRAIAGSLAGDGPIGAPSAGVDPAALQQLGALAGQTGIDSREQALLQALGPYISGGKLQKLEKAMRAAKMAKLATSVLGLRDGLLSPGR